MEDFLGTLIYIIIAIAGIIVSIFNKKSKEEKVKQEYPEFGEEPLYRTSDNYFNEGGRSIDDFFSQQFPGEEIASEEDEEELQESDTSEEEHETAEPVTEGSQEGVRSITDERQVDGPATSYGKKQHVKRKSQHEPIEQIISRFKNDPRQAVILSEILNRKDY